MKVTGSKVTRLLTPFAVLALVPGAVVAGPASAAVTPTLVAVTATHHGGEDRVVFRFRGGLPAGQAAQYVSRLVADGSGRGIPVAGRAILQVSFRNAQAHDAGGSTAPTRTAYALPNTLLSVRSGDFEGVVTYGLGLARRTPFHVTTLHNPARVVVHVGAAFPTVLRQVWLFNRPNFVAGTPPFFVPRPRPVIAATPATGLLDRIYAGATRAERADGLSALRSSSTGFRVRSIGNGIARVQLTGGCATGGSTVNVAREIMPTLRQLATVDWIKIYDPAGHTERPLGQQDSIPACLEP